MRQRPAARPRERRAGDSTALACTGDQTMGASWQAAIALGVFVADVSDQRAEKGVIVGQFAGFDVTTEEVAEDPAEILVARVAHERARIGDHADEPREQA